MKPRTQLAELIMGSGLVGGASKRKDSRVRARVRATGVRVLRFVPAPRGPRANHACIGRGA